MIGLRRGERPAGAGGTQEWKHSNSALRNTELKPKEKIHHENAYAARHSTFDGKESMKSVKVGKIISRAIVNNHKFAAS